MSSTPNYRHPGRPKNSKGKPKYEDVDQYFQCPECSGTIDNYSWKCPHCGFSATVYRNQDGKINYSNFMDFEATEKLRKTLVRINPWTGVPV